jgi:hypothetical protein
MSLPTLTQPRPALPLLQEYERLSSHSPTGWADRISEWPGVEGEELSHWHGELIALGLLDFDLSGRELSIRYQVTHEGRLSLRQSAISTAGESPDEDTA